MIFRFKKLKFPPHVGFTLIELLAVIAVIGILAAILIPLIGTVQDRAMSAKGISNIRQSGSALLLMAASNNNEVILVGEEHPSYSSWLSELIKAGLGESVREAAVCPMHGPFEFKGSTSRTYGVPMSGFYQMDPAVTSLPGGAQTRTLHLARLPEPAKYVLLVDSVLNGTGPQWRTAWDEGYSSGPHARHNGKMNVVLADGSAASVTPEEYAELRRAAHNSPGHTVSYFNENGERLKVE